MTGLLSVFREKFSSLVVTEFKKTFIILGLPGSGKSTLAKEILKKYPNLEHISCGNLIKREIQRKNPLILSYIKKKKDIPSSVATKLAIEKLRSSRDGAIFDGFPIASDQIESLEKELRNQKFDLSKIQIIYLNISTSEAIERIKNRIFCPKCFRTYNTKLFLPKVENLCDVCNIQLQKREDDDTKTIYKRMKNYKMHEEDIMRVLDHYRKTVQIIVPKLDTFYGNF